MEITTDTLSIRFIESSDLNAIHTLHALPQTDQYNALGIPKNIAETKRTIQPWILKNRTKDLTQYTFKIESKINREFIGLFGLTLGRKKYKDAMVWYKIHPNFWGKGYATAATKAVIHFGFQTLKLHRIEAGCAIENIGSIKVLEKSGMQREGLKRKNLPLTTGWSDSYIYAILKDSFL